MFKIAWKLTKCDNIIQLYDISISWWKCVINIKLFIIGFLNIIDGNKILHTFYKIFILNTFDNDKKQFK